MKARRWLLAAVIMILVMVAACNGAGSGGVTAADLAAVREEIRLVDAAQDDIISSNVSHIGGILDRVIDLENQGGGGDQFPVELGVTIYCDGDVINADAIADSKAILDDGILAGYFTIGAGIRVNEPCQTFFVVPDPAGQPTGYAPFYSGFGWGEGANHGRKLLLKSEWQRPPGVGNKWGIRLEIPTYQPITDDHISGTYYIGKRDPWTSVDGDVWHFTIKMP